MNPGYYHSVLTQLTAAANSLPDFLEPEERQAVLARIRSVQNYCLVQIEEMIEYDARKSDM